MANFFMRFQSTPRIAPGDVPCFDETIPVYDGGGSRNSAKSLMLADPARGLVVSHP
jgi:hypothetical protein